MHPSSSGSPFGRVFIRLESIRERLWWTVYGHQQHRCIIDGGPQPEAGPRRQGRRAMHVKASARFARTYRVAMDRAWTHRQFVGGHEGSSYVASEANRRLARHSPPPPPSPLVSFRGCSLLVGLMPRPPVQGHLMRAGLPLLRPLHVLLGIVDLPGRPHGVVSRRGLLRAARG